MVTFLIISAFFLSLIAVAIYFWSKPAKNSEPELPPHIEEFKGLFAEDNRTKQINAAPVVVSKSQTDELRTRASNGDTSALQEAHSLSDTATYDEVLDAMVATAESSAQLLSIASHVKRLSLPVNKTLAMAMIDSWNGSSDRVSTAEVLHVAALSDDAGTYSKALERALLLWREKKLSAISAAELQALFTSEFWVLSSRARSTGAGFILKRTLSSARRELEETTTS